MLCMDAGVSSLFLGDVQAIADSTTSLAEISVVPLDFLLILLLLFTFMVLDRLAYTLGSHLGKVSTSIDIVGIGMHGKWCKKASCMTPPFPPLCVWGGGGVAGTSG